MTVRPSTEARKSGTEAHCTDSKPTAKSGGADDERRLAAGLGTRALARDELRERCIVAKPIE